MYRLFQLLYTYRAFLVFLFFEFVSIWLIIRSNPYHSAAYFHTSSELAGSIYEARNNVVEYLDLKQVNTQLANENARLREMLSKTTIPVIVEHHPDSAQNPNIPFQYNYLAAKAINNSTQLNHNFITINKGSKHGITPDMGVINSNGVVGKVMSVSKNFAAVASLLNIDMNVSAIIKRDRTFGTVHWNGKDQETIQLLYVPRHVQLSKGDTIVTSGYNALFPEGIMVGCIKDFSLQQNATFYNIEIELSTDFSNLSFVYVIRNPLKEEQEELEISTEKK